MNDMPDFAQLGPPLLDHRDLLFLFEHFPVAGVDPVAAARQVIEHPSTLESLLESRYVQDAVSDPDNAWLDVSPRLYFNVQLRRALAGRRQPGERQTIHYLANLLSLFLRTDRLYAVQPDEPEHYEYLVDLVAEIATASPARRFLIEAHLANYALYLSGICAPWIEHRRRYRNRPLTLGYYCGMSRSYYAQAASETQAQTLGLRAIYAQLVHRFDYFRDGLERLAQNCLPSRGRELPQAF